MNQTQTQKRIKKLRIERGYSINKLAKLTETSTSYIWQLENDNCNPTLDKLLKISSALGVTVQYLIDDSCNKLEMNLMCGFAKLKRRDKVRIVKIVEFWVMSDLLFTED